MRKWFKGIVVATAFLIGIGIVGIGVPSMGVPILGGVTAAQAGPLIFDDVEMVSPTVVHLKVTGGLDSDVYAGQTNFYYKGKLVFQGYCNDVGDLISLGSQLLHYHTGPVTTDSIGNSLTILTSGELGYLTKYLNTDPFQEAAGQLASWETEYGSLVKITTNNALLDNQVLLDLASLSTTGTWAQGIASDDIPMAQGFTGNPVPVPEPKTLALFGAGLVGAAAIRRRKQKQAA